VLKQRAVETQRRVNVSDRMWARLVSSTNQPGFFHDKDLQKRNVMIQTENGDNDFTEVSYMSKYLKCYIKDSSVPNTSVSEELLFTHTWHKCKIIFRMSTRQMEILRLIGIQTMGLRIWTQKMQSSQHWLQRSHLETQMYHRTTMHPENHPQTWKNKRNRSAVRLY